MVVSEKTPLINPTVGSLSLGSSLTTPFSVKVNTEVPNSSEASTLTTTNLIEKDCGLNLKDLDSSDEDLSAGPSGGCTGEPQQHKK